jgi:hypothetical protein
MYVRSFPLAVAASSDILIADEVVKGNLFQKKPISKMQDILQRSRTVLQSFNMAAYVLFCVRGGDSNGELRVILLRIMKSVDFTQSCRLKIRRRKHTA